MWVLFIILAILWLIGYALMLRVPTCEARPEGSLPSCSVIVPARNEAHNLPQLLDSLRRQVAKPLEVIVVDDDSSDDTAEIAKAHDAQVIGVSDGSYHINGKSWACAQAAKVARGELFLFLDADTWLMPEGLQRLRGTWKAHGGLISAQPYHVTKAPYEALSALLNVIVMMGSRAFTFLGDRLSPTTAFGPCVLCHRNDYQSTQGHHAATDAIVEGFALARQFRTRGLPVSNFSGRGAICFRMYPRGLGEQISGWSRILSRGASGSHPLVFVGTVLWLVGAITAAFMVAEMLWSLTIVDPLPIYVTASVSVYLMYAAQMSHQIRRVGKFVPGIALFFPLLFLFFIFVYAYSFVNVRLLRRGRWKARRFDPA